MMKLALVPALEIWGAAEKVLPRYVPRYLYYSTYGIPLTSPVAVVFGVVLWRRRIPDFRWFSVRINFLDNSVTI